MELYQDTLVFEKIDKEIKLKTKERDERLLENMANTPLSVNDLIGENLKKLTNILNTSYETNNSTRLQIEGMAITLTAYKLKRLFGEKYTKSNRMVDAFIETRYLSNLLKGINRNLENKTKTPEEINEILYYHVKKLITTDDTSKSYKKTLDKRRIYNILTQKYFMKHDKEKLTENFEEIGKILENVKSGNIKNKIETELASYKKIPKESLKQMETMEVARALMHEEESIRYALSKEDNR